MTIRCMALSGSNYRFVNGSINRLVCQVFAQCFLTCGSEVVIELQHPGRTLSKVRYLNGLYTELSMLNRQLQKRGISNTKLPANIGRDSNLSASERFNNKRHM